MKLFLDDCRDPQMCLTYMYKRIGKDNTVYAEGNWLTVRSYDQFVEAVVKHWKEITHISFDHDLADGHYTGEAPDYTKIEKTGYHAAVWLKLFYLSKKKRLPIMYVHSMNPVGTENIINVFK